MKVKINDDAELVAKIRKQLADNNGYCPCKLVKNEDTLCMCKEFLEQGLGECHCGLYIKTEV